MLHGDLKFMLEVWCHAENVTYMGPIDRFRVGWNNVLENWKNQVAMKLGGNNRTSYRSITIIS
jgi:hypothetical protein